MFGIEFYPTPPELAGTMCRHIQSGHTVLEPSAGKGDLADAARERGAEVDVCEIDTKLQAILEDKGYFILANDFLTLQSSYHDHIILNPPFSKGIDHILHAYKIAKPGAKIVGLINASNLLRDTRKTSVLLEVIRQTGNSRTIHNAFEDAERSTSVSVELIELKKPEQDTKGFESDLFDMTDTYQAEAQEYGLLKPNEIRTAVECYHKVPEAFMRFVEAREELLRTWIFPHRTENDPRLYERLEKMNADLSDLGKLKQMLNDAGWKHIFDKIQISELLTKKQQNDLHRFIQEQSKVPFTTKNIYGLLDTLMQNRSELAGQAIEIAFDHLTKYHTDNREAIEGWKTNDRWQVKRRFILPFVVSNWIGHLTYHHRNNEIEDLEKCLCTLTGKKRQELYTVRDAITDAVRENKEAKTAESEFFNLKFYKKRTCHFEWKDEALRQRFNRAVAARRNWLTN